jgi:glutathione peroxidase
MTSLLLALALASVVGHSAGETTLYDFALPNIDGKEVKLSEFKGKVVVVVNVASRCGLTPQYEGLQKLYDEHREQGLVVLGFPANDFRGQEPGSKRRDQALLH